MEWLNFSVGKVPLATLYIYSTYSGARLDIFSEIWSLNMWGDLKFEYKVPYWLTLNWPMQSQTKPCNLQLLYEICAIVGYYAV